MEERGLGKRVAYGKMSKICGASLSLFLNIFREVTVVFPAQGHWGLLAERGLRIPPRWQPQQTRRLLEARASPSSRFMAGRLWNVHPGEQVVTLTELTATAAKEDATVSNCTDTFETL